MPSEKKSGQLITTSDRLQPFIDALPDAVVIVDLEHRITMVNSRASDMFGYRKDEMEGSDLSMLIPEFHQDRHKQLVSDYFEGPTARPMAEHKRFQGVHADGSKIPVDIMINTIMLDERKVAMSLVRDVSYQRALENRLILESLTDPMTGFFNRKHFNKQLEAQHSGFIRSGQSCCVIMFDFDRFKKINDKRGHEAGDMVLVETANMIKKELRPLDVACRIGGEEFAIILPNTTLPSAMLFAERIRHAIEHLEFRVEGSTFHATATMSVATFLASDESHDAIMRRADKALYIGKEAGRNCVVSQDSLPQSSAADSTFAENCSGKA